MPLVTSAWRSGERRCPICGARGYACGGPTTHTGVFSRMNVRGENALPDLVNVPHTDPHTGMKTTLRLPADQAPKEEPEPKPKAEEEPPAHKARAPRGKGDVATK